MLQMKAEGCSAQQGLDFLAQKLMGALLPNACARERGSQLGLVSCGGGVRPWAPGAHSSDRAALPSAGTRGRAPAWRPAG